MRIIDCTSIGKIDLETCDGAARKLNAEAIIYRFTSENGTAIFRREAV